MNQLPIALQVYSVHKEAKADLPGTLERIAAMGYDGVEFAGFYDYDVNDIKQTLDDTSLKPYSSHVSIDMLLEDTWQQTVEQHQTLGCDRLVVYSLPEEYRKDIDAWLRAAELFTKLDERLRSVDMRTGFHAHWMEFTQLSGGEGERGWDIIARETPDTFIMQYDTANGMQGGADPVQPIRDYPGRCELLHLKEYIKVADGQDPMEGHGHAIGEGGVPWNDVFDAAETAGDSGGGGTKLYIIEQEGHPTLNPMEAAVLSVKNLRELLAARPS